MRSTHVIVSAEKPTARTWWKSAKLDGMRPASRRFTLATMRAVTSSRNLFTIHYLLFLSCTVPNITYAGLELMGSEVPNFKTPISNVTVAVGREAILECVIDNLSLYKVAWLRVDTQTILTIHNHVITKNHRIAVRQTEHRNWYLHIRDVKESDMGWYMCQINTDPMKSQMGFLRVVVPPDILDYPTSSDMVIREGSNVSLQCAAAGSPEPFITWRRENGEMIITEKDIEVPYFEGPVLNISKINRLQMGPYLCIASNGVPPSVSKRILLRIHFPPMIWIQNQLVGATVGQQITLECHSEAFPKSINYWTKDDDRIISQGTKYEPVFVDNTYKVHMKLTIYNVSQSDYGLYKCLAKNSLGETDGTIKLYHVEAPTTRPPEIVPTVILETIKAPPKNVKDQESPSINSLSNKEVLNGKTNEIDDTNNLKDEFAMAELQTVFPSSNVHNLRATILMTMFPLFLLLCR